MLIAYSMPAITAVNLGAGSTWLTTDAGSALFDGKPARATRIQRTSGTPTINLTLASAIGGLRVLGLLGLNLPPGVTVTALGASGVTRRLSDGTVACWLAVLAGAASANVSVVIDTAQATIQIGELVVMPAVEVLHQSDWSVDLIDPSATELSIGSQPSTLRRAPYRRLAANFTPAELAVARGGGLANGDDWDRLRAAVAQDRRCVVAPRWKTTAGAVDQVELTRTAIYGTARIAAITHLGGNYYSSAIAASEAPPLN